MHLRVFKAISAVILLLLSVFSPLACGLFDEDKPFKIEAELVRSVPSIAQEKAVSSFATDNKKLLHITPPRDSDQELFRVTDIATGASSAGARAYPNNFDKTVFLTDNTAAGYYFQWLHQGSGVSETCIINFSHPVTGSALGSRQLYGSTQLQFDKSENGSRLLVIQRGIWYQFAKVNVLDLQGSGTPFASIYTYERTSGNDAPLTCGAFLNDSTIISGWKPGALVHRIGSSSVVPVEAFSSQELESVVVMKHAGIVLFGTKTTFILLNYADLSHIATLTLPDWVKANDPGLDLEDVEIAGMTAHPALPLVLIQLKNSDQRLYLNTERQKLGLDKSELPALPRFSKDGAYAITQSPSETSVWKIKGINL